MIERQYAQSRRQSLSKSRVKANAKSRGQRIRRSLVYMLAASAYLYVSSSLLLFEGPFTALRAYVIGSFAISRHAYLLRPLSLFTVSNAEIQKHSVDWTLSANAPSTEARVNFRTQTNNSIQIQDYSCARFTAKIMLVSDPRSVQVAVTKYRGKIGETVEEFVKDHGAIAGVNGGAFSDTAWQGTGGIPLGTVVTNGTYLQVSPTRPVIGMTSGGQLICGTYTEAELKSRGVVDALCYGPILIQDGKPVALADVQNGAPRAAIGQRADGTIIFIVTDGRNLSHPFGANYTDLQKLMLHYGAITAANLDGGSSTTMVYNGKLINNPPDILGERYIATAFVVFKH